jgi:hypothetical protein
LSPRRVCKTRRIAEVWICPRCPLDRPQWPGTLIGALLLAYYDPHGKLVYTGHVGSGINTTELQRLWRRLQPLATDKMRLDLPPPRSTRFGSPLV